MTRRVYLHVGPFKTGSTYLQGSLRERRAALAERGVLYPAPTRRGHQRVIVDLMGRKRERRSTVPALGAWGDAVEEIRRWDGDVAVVSGESLSAAGPETVRRAVLTVAPAEVHVVAVLRDLAALIPSHWQNNLRNRKHATWPDYAASLRGDDGASTQSGDRFWRVMDVSAVLRRWAEEVPPERIHVVVMPASGAPPAELWTRFCTAVGIADPPEPEDEVRNAAIGTDQAEALRRLNAGLAGQYPDYLYARYVKRVATRAAMQSSVTRRMVLPPEDFEWVRERAQRIVDDVVTSGYHVVGDPADAVPAAPSVLTPDGPFRPDDCRLDAVADASTRMAVSLLHYLSEHDPHAAPRPDDDLDAVELLDVPGVGDDDSEAGAGSEPDTEEQRRERRRERRHERRAAEASR